MNEQRTGDTAHTDEKPALVDTSGDDIGPAQGDRPKDGHVDLVDVPEAMQAPTAKELRKAGYVVPEDVKDSDVPPSIISDTLPVEGEDHLVEHLETVGDELTPLERIAKTGRESDSKKSDSKK